MKRKIYAIMASLSIALTFATTTYAKVDGFLVKDPSTGKMYQYAYDELMNAAVTNAMGFDSLLFDEYKSRQTGVTGFHDDQVGYVSADAVNNAAISAAIGGTTFDLQGFLDKADSSMKVQLIDTDSIQKRAESNGKVVDGEVITPGQTDDFDVIEIQ